MTPDNFVESFSHLLVENIAIPSVLL